MLRTFSLSRFLFVVCLVILTGMFTLVISAQGPDNGEPAGASPAGPAQGAVPEEEVGVQNQADEGVAVADNGELERRPERVTNVVEEETIDDGSLAPGVALFFKRWAAETFVQYNSTNTWGYNGGGCIHRTGGTDFWDTDVQLPDGAEIDFLRVYFYDNDASRNAQAYLFRFDNTGGSTQVASATGSGTPGFSSAGSGFFSHTVDNTPYSYILRIDFNGATNSNLQICAVRIRYQFNIATLSLPVIRHLESP